MDNKMSDLVTLTTKFDLLLRNFNLGHSFLIRRGTFLVTRPLIYDLATLTLKIDLLLKNFNLGHNLRTRRSRAFIFHMCVACDKTLHTALLFFTSGPCRLTYFSKILFWAMTFESEDLNIVAIYIWLPPASYICCLSDISGLQNCRTLNGSHFNKRQLAVELVEKTNYVNVCSKRFKILSLN